MDGLPEGALPDGSEDESGRTEQRQVFQRLRWDGEARVEGQGFEVLMTKRREQLGHADGHDSENQGDGDGEREEEERCWREWVLRTGFEERVAG